METSKKPWPLITVFGIRAKIDTNTRLPASGRLDP